MIGVVFMVVGIIGIFKFENFYTRILVAAKIDTVAVLTVIIGFAVLHGLSSFSLKLLLLLCIIMILDPLATHMVARSAYLSGYKIEDHQTKGKQAKDSRGESS